MKKTISLIVAVFMIFSALPVGAFAESNTEEGAVTGGIYDGWEYRCSQTEGSLYREKDGRVEYLFEDYTVTNVFTVGDEIYAVMYDGNGEYVQVNAVTGDIFEDEDSAELLALSNEQIIFNYCVNEMGFNIAAASAVLANIKCESGFRPNAKGDYQNGVYTSYGICQWHAGRFTKLKEWCANNGFDYTTLTGQLNYLKYELKNSYSSVWNRLTGIANTAEGAYDAGAYWCARYEVPAGYGYWSNGVLYYGTTSVARGNSAKNTYWPKYRGTTTSTDKTYSPAAALAYAKAHWDDGKGQCAEFVSDCLTAGGVSVSINTTGKLRQFLLNNGYAVDFLVETAQGKKIKMADHPGKVSAGDVVINYCIECGVYPHVGLISGTNSKGQITYYAHNGAIDGTVAWWNSSTGYKKHPDHTFKTYVLHMTGAGNSVAHTHSFTAQYASGHPHTGYNVCSCGTKVSLGTKLVSTCKSCYPLGAVRLTRSVEKTRGTAVFHRDEVENATKYILEIYSGGALKGQYVMSGRDYTVTGLSSGEYTAVLTAVNTNTEEKRTAGCESFKIVDTYEVSYNANGGTNAPSSQIKIQDDDSFTLTASTPVRKGYVFTGWAASKNALEAQYKAGASYTKNAKITLYAVWTPEVYTVSFDANEGKGSLPTVTITYGDTLKLPNSIVRNGYYLKGWSRGRNAAEAEYAPGRDLLIEESMTLYAVWGSGTWAGDVADSLPGKGTEAEPYEISDAADLAYLAQKVNTQTGAPEYEYYVLTDNINLGYNEWVPVGLYDSNAQYFYGSFDGRGYTVSDLYITDENEGYAGLFGYVKDSEIKNLTVTGAIENVTGSTGINIGAVTAYGENTVIKECRSMYFGISGISAATDGYSNIGAVAGCISGGEINSCIVEESHINIRSGAFCIGMVAGKSTGLISDCRVEATESGLISTVSNAGNLKIGGIAGSAENDIKNCIVKAPYLAAPMKTSGSAYLGGIAGYSNSEVRASAAVFFKGQINELGSGSYTSSMYLSGGNGWCSLGGIAGKADTGAQIIDCEYDGESITGYANTGYITIGGLAGMVQGAKSESLEVNGSISNTQRVGLWALPQKEGYVATWYTDKAFESPYDLSRAVTEDVTLYAKWEKGETDVWDGSIEEPDFDAATKTYYITNASQLAWIASVSGKKVTTGDNMPASITFSGYTIELLNDICLNDVSDWEEWGTTAPDNEWTPVGSGVASAFGGTFNGNGYHILGMYSNRTAGNTGLFGYVLNGTIKNLVIDKSYIKGAGNVGAVAGIAVTASITGCVNNALIKSTGDKTGGIAGYISHTTVKDCVNRGMIASEGSYVGGIAGSAQYSTVESCVNFGEITATVTGAQGAGGVIGYGTYGVSVKYCGNDGAVNGYFNVGGITGQIYGGIDMYACYNLSAVAGCRYVGGIAGDWNVKMSSSGALQSQIIEACYSAGTVDCDDYDGLYAGLCGLISSSSAGMTASMKNCYTTHERTNVVSTSGNVTLSAENVKGALDWIYFMSLPEGFTAEEWSYFSESSPFFPCLTVVESAYKTYTVTAVTDASVMALTRSFANVDGALAGRALVNSYVGGLIGRGNGKAAASKLLSIADIIRSESEMSGSFKSYMGLIIAEDDNDSVAVDTAYYENTVDMSATVTNSVKNEDGTARSEKLMKVKSFQTNLLGLKAYTSLENIKEDEAAVWVLKDDELPELYHTCLNDITISEDIVNGSISVDRERAIDGEVALVTAVADEGYVLNSIYVNGEEITGESFIVDGDCDVYATFTEKIACYSVEVVANDNATGTLLNVDNSEMMLMAESDSLSANDGEEVQINATAGADYAIETIRVNGEEITGNSFIVTDDSVVTMEVVSIRTEVDAVTNDVNEEDITLTTAVVSGSVLTEGEGISRYIKYWSTEDPTDVYTTEVAEGSGDYSVTLENLEPGTNYCYQMTEYGQIKHFTTVDEMSESEYVAEEETLEISIGDTGEIVLTLTGSLDGKVIAALYTDDSLEEVVICDAAKETDIAFEKKGNRIKAMWVESITTLMPVCEAKEKDIN